MSDSFSRLNWFLANMCEGESIPLAALGDPIGPVTLPLLASSIPLVMTDRGVVLKEADGGGVIEADGL